MGQVRYMKKLTHFTYLLSGPILFCLVFLCASGAMAESEDEDVALPAPVVAKGRIPIPGKGVLLMPTKDCRQCRLSSNEILIEKGGLLVKTTRGAVIISAFAGTQKVMTTIEKNTLALVTWQNNAVGVTTFVSNHDTDVSVYLPAKDGKTYELHVPVGTEADFFGLDNPAIPFSILMAREQRMRQHQMENGTRVHTFRFDYPRAVRHYDLAKSLPAKDYERLLHHAAAVTMVIGR